MQFRNGTQQHTYRRLLHIPGILLAAETGGKRLRAMLPLLTAEALGADPNPLVPFGAASARVRRTSRHGT